MNPYVRFLKNLDKPPSTVEREQFQKVMLDCIEPGVGYSVFFLIGCAALYGHVPTVYLVICGCILLVDSVVKISLVKKFEKQNAEQRANPLWRRIIWLGAAFTGVFFGLLSLVLLIPLPQANLMVLAFTYLGVYMTSCWLGSSYLPVLVNKLVPLTLPLALAMIWVATPMLTLVSFALVFMSGMSLFYVRSIVRQHTELVYARQRIEHISENLTREKLAAEKLIIDKSRFIASASHDLRQPLHALGLFHSAIRSEAKNEKIHALMDSVDSSTSALNNLFEGLLDVSRFDSGAVEPVYEHFKIDCLATALYEEMFQMAKSVGLLLELKCDRCVVYSDKLLIEQVLRNLLGNAIKFTKTGSIVLSATCNNKIVSVSVSDTGPGIPEADIKTIFNEFHQIQRSNHHEDKGFGLGLAIVRRITELLDIPLKISPVEPHGVVFLLELPAGTESQAQALTVTSSAGETGSVATISKSRVMLIDDNVSILDGMQTVLMDWNVDCLTASSREQAIQCLQETGFIPDLLICDYHLALGENGVGVARAVCDYVGRDVPVIVITGDTLIDIAHARLTGLDVLYKPVSPGDLQTAIRANLDRDSLLSRDLVSQ